MSAPLRIVIAGLPRCGTTLLATLLSRQPRCRFVTDYVRWTSHATERLGVGWSQPLSLSQRRVCLAIARDDLLRYRHAVLASTDEFSTIDQLHRAISSELADGALAVGHKSLLSPSRVAAILDETDVEVVVMVRDPRPAALSYWHRTGGGVEAYLEDWRRTVRWVLRERSPRLTVLRFEDLVTNPEDSLAKITRRWGDEPSVPSQLRFEGVSYSVGWTENSAFGDVTRPIDTTPLERWHEHRESRIVRYADVVCRAELEQLGHAPLPRHEITSKARMKLHALYHAFDGHLGRAFATVRKRARERFAPPLDVRD